MPIGIDPTVDFAFKQMLGNPHYPAVTIHFLNAVLRTDVPIASVEILNPIQDKDRSEDKIVVLDILARDADGQRFNVEMQSTRQVDLQRRLLFYSSLSYARQISEGDLYTALRPVFSICVLDDTLFPYDYPRYHHSFRLRCDQASDLVFSDDLEFHTLELPKFMPSSNNVSELSAEEKWLYLLVNAENMESEEISSLLVDPPLRQAIGILDMISKNPDDLQFYEARLKYLRDQRALTEALEAAREAEKKAREEGREEGEIRGKIHLLQEMLGEPISPNSELDAFSVNILQKMLEDLQGRLRNRNTE